MGGPLDILRASWRDFRPVLALERACFPHDSWPWIDVLAALTFPDTVRLMATWEGVPAGFVIGDLRRREDLGWIATIGVRPDFRRRGIGRKLLRACEEAMGTARVRLTLRESNEGAHRLYLQEGYTQIDVWNRYYRDGESGIVMEKLRVPGTQTGPGAGHSPGEVG
jgi:ribosomal-protein-alanine N-acetyltransferase